MAAGTRFVTLSLLLGALLLAVGTPVYLGMRDPSLRFYLLTPIVLAFQFLPYVLTAVIYLPRNDRNY